MNYFSSIDAVGPTPVGLSDRFKNVFFFKHDSRNVRVLYLLLTRLPVNDIITINSVTGKTDKSLNLFFFFLLQGVDFFFFYTIRDSKKGRETTATIVMVVIFRSNIVTPGWFF